MALVTASACFNVERIVAELVASGRGLIQEAPIAAGKLATKKARPVKAGFQTFEPRPPKSCLATMIAKKEPKIVCQRGSVGGNTKANKRPVITAEPSPALCLFFVILLKSHSLATAVATLAQIVSSAGIPKRITP